MVQGHALSRLHLAKGPETTKDDQTDAITSDDLLAVAKAVEMTDLEAGGRKADTHTDRHGQNEQDLRRRDSSQTDGGKHVHMADTSTFGANQHGGNRSKEADKTTKLWDDMLKRKVGADMEKQKRDGIASNLQSEEEDHMARVDSHASLLDPTTLHSSDRVSGSGTLASPHQPPPQHLPPLDQHRFLSKLGLMGALDSSRRFLPALLKKTDRDLSEASASGGGGAHGGGSGGRGAKTASSMDSNGPLLPAGAPSGQWFKPQNSERGCKSVSGFYKASIHNP